MDIGQGLFVRCLNFMDMPKLDLEWLPLSKTSNALFAIENDNIIGVRDETNSIRFLIEPVDDDSSKRDEGNDDNGF